jgi:Helix-turn-helix domain
MDEKKTTPEKEAALKNLRDQFTGTDTYTQINLLAAALRLFSVTTYEASRWLDIYHPAGRIKDLRDAGFEILTMWTTTKTEANVSHRIGRYVLIREPQQERAA